MKTQLPVYNDGIFHLYKIKSGDSSYQKKLIDMEMDICFRENGIGDSLKSELKQNDIQVTTKITIPQYRIIDPEYVVEIDGIFHRVYNAYHSTNKDGYKETTLTLEEYSE